MAADAVLKVKESEEKGSEMIKRANETAKEIVRKAEIDGVNKQKSIIDGANRMRKEMIEAAVKKASDSCAFLIEAGEKENKSILNPDKQKFEKASEIAIERIVNAHGNC